MVDYDTAGSDEARSQCRPFETGVVHISSTKRFIERQKRITLLCQNVFNVILKSISVFRIDS